jgi:hypothetical protein
MIATIYQIFEWIGSADAAGLAGMQARPPRPTECTTCCARSRPSPRPTASESQPACRASCATRPLLTRRRWSQRRLQHAGRPQGLLQDATGEPDETSNYDSATPAISNTLAPISAITPAPILY